MRYAERERARLAGADLWLANAGYRWQRLFGARVHGESLAAEVAARARRQPAGERRAALASLRYRLRRDGASREPLLDCFGLYYAACGALGRAEPPPQALAAAAWAARGGIAALGERAARDEALALAAFALAVRGPAAHLLVESDAAAQARARALQPVFAAAGLEIGVVEGRMDGAARRRAYAQPLVCVAHREAGLDYLRDRALRGGRPGAARARIAALTGDGREGAADRLLLGGLHCALVAEADAVMLDDARAPLVIAREADAASERLVYEQAMELARTLKADDDFTLEDGAPALGEAAAALLERLVRPLGGIWAVREGRESLVRLALQALHLLERERDYRVEKGRVVLPPRPAEVADAEAGADALLKAMLEVKEGCRSGERRDVVARISVPEFLGRYVHLGGLCADARGLEGEFWTLYGAKTARAGALPAPSPARERVFVTRAARDAALRAAPEGSLVVLRSEKEAQALALALGERPDLALALYPPAAPAAASTLLVAELLDARRHVAALCERYPGRPCALLLALEDERMAGSLPAALRALGRWLARGGELPRWAAALTARAAQRRVEQAQALARLELAARQQTLNELLAFSGPAE